LRNEGLLSGRRGRVVVSLGSAGGVASGKGQLAGQLLVEDSRTWGSDVINLTNEAPDGPANKV